MIRQNVEKYWLKDFAHIEGKSLGGTIPIFVSEDGRRMSLNAESMQGNYECWHMKIREDYRGQYCELPLMEEEFHTLLGRVMKP